MLSKINISNLDNSVTESEVSIYSDACQNTMELEEHYKKMNELKSHEIKNNKKEKENNSSINNINNNKIKNYYQNDISRLSMSEAYESCEEDNSNIKEKEQNNVNNNKFIEKKESDNLKIFYENKNESINLKNKNSINEIINNNNINNVKLSNINIIINKGDNFYNNNINNKNETSKNLPTIKEKNKRYNLTDNSSLSNLSMKKEIKLENNRDNKNIYNNNNDNEKDNNEENIYENENNSKIKGNLSNNKEEIKKNLNVNELTKIKNTKDKNNEKLNESNMKNSHEKNSINSLSSNLHDFDSVTVITKIKKKSKKNLNNSITKSFNSYNDNTSFLSIANTFLVNSIKFDGIGNNEIDLDFLKSLRTIPIKYKNKNKKKYLKTLLELQHFFIDDSEIRVIKISEDGQYLSTGMRSGKIKLFEIIGYDYNKFELLYDKQTALNYLNFINEKQIKTLKGHNKDVMDLSWSAFFHNLLLSCSLDNLAILWDVNLSEEKCRIQSFDHKAIVTCISFNPIDKYIFATGCFDKYVRIWDFKDILDRAYHNSNNNNDIQSENKIIKKKIESDSKENNELIKHIKLYFNIQEKITALSFFPTGEKIAIGTHNGKINIYELRSDNFFYKGSFNCRNRIGKNSLGKKITSIEFFNKNDAIISSCDSRIRLMSMSDGKLIHKYKGHLNEDSMIKSSIDYNYDIIISGSENGFCYLWDIDSEEKKNLNCEFFKPYSQELIHCSLIVPEKCYCNFLKKVMKITDKLLVISIIINATSKGRLEVLLNIDEKY